VSFGAWLGVGLLAGIIGNAIAGRFDDRRGCCMTIIIGMVGAILGGVVMAAITGRDWRDFINGFNIETILVASLGAIILIAFVNLIGRGRYGGPY
jgi:uncharacterized membrane protein YeaQ/YmgE (transglycosylase-associated protein family)